MVTPHHTDISQSMASATNKECKLLLIVDPQIDFINGTLPVPDAEKAMDNLARYVYEHGEEYEMIIVTSDRHSFLHCSFEENGGPWPRHCVESTVGAALWPPLAEALSPFAPRLVMLYKGQEEDREEYSIFNNDEAAQIFNRIIGLDGGKVLGSAFTKADREIKQIDICGLAGDVCVARTLDDALKRYPLISFNILMDCTASLDSGLTVSSLQSRLSSQLIKCAFCARVPNYYLALCWFWAGTFCE